MKALKSTEMKHTKNALKKRSIIFTTNIRLRQSIIFLVSFFTLILASVSGSFHKESIYSNLSKYDIQTINESELKQEYKLHSLDTYSSTVNVVQNILPTLNPPAKTAQKSEITPELVHANTIPDDLHYKVIKISELREFLRGNHSILSNEPYFSTILSTAKAYDINPMLLFAITGQEQSLVPESNKNARSIANNPYNVHVSWRNYNTNIVDSSRIAANTIIRLANNCPDGVDPFKWINKKYASDPNWWKGVKVYYSLIDRAVRE